jgi:hypothetical protein
MLPLFSAALAIGSSEPEREQYRRLKRRARYIPGSQIALANYVTLLRARQLASLPVLLCL